MQMMYSGRRQILVLQRQTEQEEVIENIPQEERPESTVTNATDSSFDTIYDNPEGQEQPETLVHKRKNAFNLRRRLYHLIVRAQKRRRLTLDTDLPKSSISTRYSKVDPIQSEVTKKRPTKTSPRELGVAPSIAYEQPEL